MPVSSPVPAFVFFMLFSAVQGQATVSAQELHRAQVPDALKLAQARDSVNRVNALIQEEQAKGRVVDYFRVRAFCISHSLRVADLARQRAQGKPNRTTPRYEKIYHDAVRYVSAAAARLLADVRAFVDDSGNPGLAIPRPDLYQAWSVRNGDLYSGSEPITLHGVVWLWGFKDSSYSLYDLGMNMQTMDVGPNAFVGEGFTFPTGSRPERHDLVQFYRRIGLEGQNWGEVFELHTSPHYVPSWFKPDNHNAWLDTPDGQRLLELTYRGQAEAFKDVHAIKTADLANEFTFWSTSSEAMAGFRRWLKQRHGSVEKLNQRWQTDFHGFDGVPSPLSSAMHDISQPLHPEGIYQHRGPYWDWCSYNSQRAAGVVRWMNATFHKYFPNLLTQVKCVLSAREYRTLAVNFIVGIDPQQIDPITDLIGTDASYLRGGTWKGTLFAYDYMKSICPNKPIVCTETHAVPYDDGMAPGEIRRGLFQRFIHGERLNLMFLYGSLARNDTWGDDFEDTTVSCWNVCTSPETLESVALTSADLRRLTASLSFFGQRQPDVLIFYDNAADFGVPQSSTPPGQYADRALHVYESLLYEDVKVSFVTESMLAARLPKAPLIVLAGARFVSDQTVGALKEYLAKGGRLLWLGDNLHSDHYGAARPPALLTEFSKSDRVGRSPVLASAKEYAEIWPQQFALAGLKPPFAAVGRDGKCAWGVEIRSATEPDGRRLVFLANTNQNPVQLALRQHSHGLMDGTNLITGKKVKGSNINLAINDVMLLREEAAERLAPVGSGNHR